MALEWADQARTIRLGREAPFDLGPLRVEPATRQVLRGDRRETIEPRIMQVLVALARAEGAVVSRDALIETCWGGVVVGDNAIHRAISRLRELAEALGPGAFQVETVPRVGYRLTPTAPAEPTAPAARPRSRPAALARLRTAISATPALAAGAAVAAVVGAIGAGLFAYGVAASQPKAPSLTVVGDGGPEAMTLAHAVEVELPRLVGGEPVAFALAEPNSAKAQTDYVARVAAETRGSVARADLSVVSRGGDLLWSGTLERPSDATAGMDQELAGRLAAAVDCLGQAKAFAPGLDAATVRIYVAACERLPADPDDQTLSLLKTVNARRKDFGPALAWEAFTEGALATDADFVEAHASAEALRAAGRERLGQAKRLKVRPGLLALAAASLLPRHRWRDQVAQIERAVSIDRGYAPPLVARSHYLEKVGRMSEAVNSLRRAAALAPLDPYVRSNFIYILAYSGQVEAARTELTSAERIWPDVKAIREIRANIELRFGDPQQYIRAYRSGALAADWAIGAQRDWISSFVAARANPTPQNIEAAVETARRVGGGGRIPPAPFQVFGYFGRVDEAFSRLADPRTQDEIGDSSEVLFRSYMRPLRLDRRFMAAAARMGLVDDWRRSGKWPDFCRDPALLYDCHREADSAVRALD